MSSKNTQKLQEAKARLEGLKEANPSEWTAELQGKLDAVNAELASDAGATAKTVIGPEREEKSPEQGFKPRKGEERNTIVKVYRGDLYDPQTGKQKAVVWTENFTPDEWGKFVKYGAGVGLKIKEVVYDPTGEASKMVSK